MYDVRVGSSTGSLYYFGVSSSPYNVLVIKTDSSDTVMWSKFYNQQASFDMFVIDPFETYLYMTSYLGSTYFPLHKVATDDGSVVKSKKIANFKSLSSFAALRYYGATSTLHFNGVSTGLGAPLML